ncbi:type VII secretion protein EssB [Clostridium tetanomorphum]|uniref:Type VII secretion protein EssB n=1 Tax=Clostridium tetanomorphum TaxID=1553 RepID=A0A923E4Z4_CLOTT|nr:type VII secretion protein EssB [Clostridium tetanomorphum]KAJ49491.1 type VII secretion protein EssB [Clostridium tetanomorphum DSM 665]KAJ51432.1 type VII secretion protein EssB [Clostridium tetanomorphum DSM 665]MBC2396525.1 type VII secretion protein EssB [Clostridium tetanomorphum]MBP1863851.1 type VII secretion protein EssB [Clostridium tetanomorphum]NRS84929.1 type VII secretion protein EssB [Clostridium tetanomorphum]
MKENEFEKIVKISELNAKRDSEINRITYENTYLIPCKVNIKDEEVKFTYDLNELQPFSEIKNRRDVEKLRFLINVSNVLKIADEYSFKLEPNNIYYDYNYIPKILNRDIRLEDEIIDYKDLILHYKSLIADVFNKQYSYNDFYNGGMDLIKKNKKIKKYILLETIEEIKNELLEDLKVQEREDKEKYIEIKLKNYKVKKYSIWAMSLVILVLMIYTVYASVFLIPFNQKVIKANSYYMKQDYEGVIKCFENTRGLKLDKESKCKLAYSYVMSENLAENKKKNIIATLNDKSDENILDYWIAIGRSKYDNAIDLAKKVQDNELLLYALLNKQKYIQDNNKMTGEEKQKAQEGLQSEIEKLTKELNIEKEIKKNKVKDSTTTNTSKNKSTKGDKLNKSGNGLNLVPSK